MACERAEDGDFRWHGLRRSEGYAYYSALHRCFGISRHRFGGASVRPTSSLFSVPFQPVVLIRPQSPSAERFSQGPLDVVRRGLLACFAFGLFLAPALVAAALVLIWVWWLAAWRAGSRFEIPPVVWVTLAFVLYLLLRAALPNAVSSPDPGRTWATVFDLAQLAVFVPIAFAIGGDRRLLRQLLVLALVGLIIGTLWRADWPLMLADWHGYILTRPGFGFPALAYALYAGTALIGLVALRHRVWYGVGRHWRWWAFACWLAAFLLLLQGVVMTSARGSWLALTLVALLGLLLHWRAGRPVSAQQGRERQQSSIAGDTDPRRGSGSTPTRAITVALAAALIGLMVINGDEILDRFALESDALFALLRGDSRAETKPEAVRPTSVGQRWHAQHLALKSWLERPWIGWGPGSSRGLIAQSDQPELNHPIEGPLKHLHNSYAELLVQTGALGLGLWLLIGGLLLAMVYRAVRSGRLDRDLGLFLLLSLLYLALWSLFNYRMENQDFRGYWAFLAGAALSVGLAGRRVAAPAAAARLADASVATSPDERRAGVDGGPDSSS